MLSWIVTSCALILAVMLLRRIFRGRASARAIYALWLFVALRLLIPGSVEIDSPVPSVESAVSRAPVVQLSGAMSEAEHVEYTGSGTVEAQFTPDSSPVTVAENVTQREFDIAGLLSRMEKLLPAIYFTGAAAVALVFAATWVRFSRQVRRSRRELDVVGSPVSVYVSDGVDTPCLFGLIRPAVYIPSAVVADGTLLRHALTHELTHYRQHDHIWCVVRSACLVLHWYDPLVWYAAHLSKRDCELACDEATVSRLGESERANYGRSLIELTTSHARGAAVATSMCAGAGELKDRIRMLTRRKHSVIALVLAALLTLSATACSFVGSGETSPEPNSFTGTLTPSENDSAFDSVYDFTAPSGTKYAYYKLYSFDGSEWQPVELSEHYCGASSGQLIVDLDPGEMTLGCGLVQSNGKGSYALLELGAYSTDGAWSYTALTDAAKLAMNSETPLMVLYSAGTDTASLDCFTDPESIAGAAGKYLCLTVVFSDAEPEYVGVRLRGGTPYGEYYYDFTAPVNADSLVIRAYELRGGQWQQLDSAVYDLDAHSGSISMNFYPDTQSAEYGVEFGSGEYEYKSVTYDLAGLAVAPDPCGEFNVNFEFPLAMLYSGSGYNERGGFRDPELLGADDGFICFTATFTGEIQDLGSGEAPAASSPPQIDAQSSDMVGFRSTYSEGESYEQVASAWAQSYADNLVYGLPSTDGASCTSVEVQTCKLSAASLTEPKHLVVLMNLKCTPRDANAFGITFGNAVYAEPTPENSSEPCDVLLGGTLVLNLNNGTTECISAATDTPDMWGFQSFEEYDDPDYIANFADAGMSAERIVSLVNYGKLNEASSKSKHALHKALSEVSIAPDGADDQLIRDMYAMLAVRYADGAYSVWLGNIYREQREHDPETFSAALAAFDPETQEHITYLADTPL